jgi:hypothetical protein
LNYSKTKQNESKMKIETEKNQMNHPRTVSRAEWPAARLKDVAMGQRDIYEAG